MDTTTPSPATRLRITFDNGVTLRGSYRHTTTNQVAVEVAATDSDGQYLHTIRRTFEETEGFVATVKDMEDLKQHLLACNINKFAGKAGMDIVRGVLVSVEKFYRQTAAAA